MPLWVKLSERDSLRSSVEQRPVALLPLRKSWRSSDIRNGDGSLRYAAHLQKYLSVPTLVYRCVVQRYGKQIGIEGAGFGAHALRATAATNVLDNGADIAKVQEWLGHANV